MIPIFAKRYEIRRNFWRPTSWWKFNFWGKYWTLCLSLTVFRVNWEGLSDKFPYQLLIGLAEHQSLASHAHEAARRALISSIVNAVVVVVKALWFVGRFVFEVVWSAFFAAHSHEAFWSPLVPDRSGSDRSNHIVVAELLSTHPEESLSWCPLGEERRVAVVGFSFRFDEPWALTKTIQVLWGCKNTIFPD